MLIYPGVEQCLHIEDPLAGISFILHSIKHLIISACLGDQTSGERSAVSNEQKTRREQSVNEEMFHSTETIRS